MLIVVLNRICLYFLSLHLHPLFFKDNNKKDSPIVESSVVKSSVVKKTAAATDNKQASAQTKGSTKDNADNYNSIAELKKATDIVDVSAKDNTTDSQAQKKAKLKDELINESKEARAMETETDASATKKPASKTNEQSEKKMEDTTAKKPTTTAKSTASTKSAAATKTAATKSTTTKKTTSTAAKKTSARTAKKTNNSKLSAGQHRVAILGANRIPFARSNGPYSDASNTDMLTAALNGLVVTT